MNKFKLVLISSLLALSAFNVQALPITGTLDMFGGATVLDASGAQTNDASAAVAVDFTSNNFFRVTAGDGDFAGLAGSLGTIKDFTFDPFAGSIADFWQVGAFSFELTDVIRGTSNDPSNFLVLNGTGIISATAGLGLDATSATWSFSGNSTGNGLFTWSAASANVPEPGVLALLSLGLIVIGLRKRFA
ncbi:hypothetical protein MNBD_GAMMA06-551 [hydrothermal vent metagenome]|uniref:Ice-binding protein C-terminal domain-containing protein n=1 Tax=hydrothermal vent metagenome TaxID=652676 RepID=A0A3B0WQ02_9ZZZZ